MSDIPTKYYFKELYSNPLFLNRGVRAQFEPIGNDEGIMATNDPSLIFSMENAASRRIGGVRPITKEEYDQFKKKERPTSKSSDSFPSFRATPAELTGPVVSAYLPTPKPNLAVGEEGTSHSPNPATVTPIEHGKSGRNVKKGKAPVLPG